MKICRFRDPETQRPSYGMIEGENVFTLGGDLNAGDLSLEGVEPSVRLADAQLLAPVSPSKIVCVGRNYREHAAELGNEMPSEPLLFLKAPSAVINDGDAVELPEASERVEHEGELGLVIGRRCRRLSDAEDPLAYVLGFTCVNDVTARDLQRRDVQFTRGKSFDTFCPVGPFVVTGLDPSDLLVETRVNGAVRQSGRTSAMAFPVPHLIRYISHAMTLEPGDLIATGTPAGVGPLKDGDTVEVEVEGVGVLRNPVRKLPA
ncbi:MAG TPA: fumarylacetoacetate hydrolase family protein [Pyrinomonadaceae bacterium]|jgi:2-keto-4-pentenoate hydratase/2-oxohepta-3-ene-1,7-dioic acid hydratase in catechol pathway